jgi:Tol biopolymer transport system component
VPRARILGLATLLAIPLAPAAGHASTPSVIAFSADRAPVETSEIYRLDSNGNRVTLNRNPVGDSDPLVSPDGKQVAFFSYRNEPAGQGARVYEVRIDGTHLQNMRPSLIAQGRSGSIAWQPRGDRLAAVSVNRYGSPTALWILRRGHQAKRVISHGAANPTWSPDGRVLVAWSGYTWQAFSPAGRRLWVHESKNPRGVCCGVSWSTHGLFAATTQQRLRVYDESGKKRFQAGVPKGRPSPPSWSRSGRQVALVSGKVVEVWTAKGRLVLRKRVLVLDPHEVNSVVWAGDHRLVVGLPVTGPQEGVDVSSGKLWPATDQWFNPRSADGKLTIVTRPAGPNVFTVGVAPVGGGPAKMYGEVPGCGPYGIARESLQIVGRSHSIVYETVCSQPFSNLYTVSPDGSDVRELSTIQGYARGPALSPDGSEIAYWWSRCWYCASGIRVANVDGRNTRILTNPTGCTFDGSPSWAPDGQTILYSESTGCKYNDISKLYTVPAVGGPPHDLGVGGVNPTWGPTRIAYDWFGGLWEANPDGSNPVVVAATGVLGAWSPDGRLAYTTGVGNTTVVVDSTQVQLPFAWVQSLAWSPDDTRFVVTAEQISGTQPDVYTVKTDGTDPIRLTTGYDASGASWR